MNNKIDKEPQNTILQKGIVVCLLAVFCCLLWGSAFPCIKLGYEYFAIASDEWASQIFFAGMRFTIAGLMVVLGNSIWNRRLLLPAKTSVPRILRLCLLQTVLQYTFFYIGLANTTGVKASIIEAANVFIAILVASLLFHQESMTWRKVLGCLVGFVGVVYVNMNGEGIDLNMTFLGEGFVLLLMLFLLFC